MSLALRQGRDTNRLHDVALSAMLAVQCFALFIAAPFAALGHSAMRSVADLLLVAYVLLVLLVSESRALRVVAVAATGCAFAGALAAMLVPSTASHVAAHAFAVVAFFVLGYSVAQAVFFSPGPINTHRILGAIVLYFNLALTFSTIYQAIRDVAPDAFTGLAGGADGPRGFASVVYFSFVTLTSTGYGDIVPVNPFARSVANLEAIIGQLYPATLLARLVAQHLETRHRPPHDAAIERSDQTPRRRAR